MRAIPGWVYLVGAGPGDPGLLTRRGAALLRAADVVLYDRLGAADLLHLASPTAEVIPVGKSPGHITLPQDQIHERLIREARAGRVVVRLKGGDPFVFGRGSEEAAACEAAGVPVEVVPGVTSAIAAPAAAGIAVTARGVARSFAVVTARTGDDTHAAEPDYAALARLDTVVFLMARAHLRDISNGLIAGGADMWTPAAVIERGTQPDQRSVFGSLRSIAALADEAELEAPVVLVVGETAAQKAIDGAGRAPLRGARILITRPTDAARPLATRLRRLGAEVITAPLIRIRYRDADVSSLRSDPPGWVAFTSLHGVRGFHRAMRAAGLDARALGGVRIAAVGPKTAAEVRAMGIWADHIAPEHRASSLIESLAPQLRPGEAVLFPCGTLAREETAAGLRDAGARVNELVVYSTELAAPTAGALQRIDRGVDVVLFHSPSGVRSLVRHGVSIGDALIGCIGPTTAAEASRHGLRPAVIPQSHTDEALIEAVIGLWAAAAEAQT